MALEVPPPTTGDAALLDLVIQGSARSVEQAHHDPAAPPVAHYPVEQVRIRLDHRVEGREQKAVAHADLSHVLDRRPVGEEILAVEPVADGGVALAPVER